MPCVFARNAVWRGRLKRIDLRLCSEVMTGVTVQPSSDHERCNAYRAHVQSYTYMPSDLKSCNAFSCLPSTAHDTLENTYRLNGSLRHDAFCVSSGNRV